MSDNGYVHDPVVIGRVLRASTRGFVCGTRSQEITQPSFGAFVRTTHLNGQEGGHAVIGLIHAISIDDDPLVRQIILANNTPTSVEHDQRQNRMVPVEIGVVCIGYMTYDSVYHSLPPRPPLSLDPVELCDAETIWHFTQQLDFLRMVLNFGEVPAEELLAASLRQAAGVRQSNRERHDFLVAAGRRLAGLLAHDLPRLQHLLRLIRPTY